MCKSTPESFEAANPQVAVIDWSPQLELQFDWYGSESDESLQHDNLDDAVYERVDECRDEFDFITITAGDVDPDNPCDEEEGCFFLMNLHEIRVNVRNWCAHTNNMELLES